MTTAVEKSRAKKEAKTRGEGKLAAEEKRSGESRIEEEGLEGRMMGVEKR